MIRLSTRWYSAKPSLPVIDFGKFLAGSVAQKQESAVKLVNAFKNVGFVYLVNHGIPKKTIDSAFAQSKKFFDLDQSVKNKLAWESPESNRGYVSPGREKVSQLICKDQVQALRDSSPDLKESLEIGKEPSQNFQNMWPVDPKFRAEMMQFYKTCHLFHLDVMDSLALGLGLGGGFFEPYCNGMDHNLRLLHYPDVKKNILDRKDQSRAGSHSGIFFNHQRLWNLNASFSRSRRWASS